MDKGQRRLAAIMFTDMVSYTTIAQKDEALSLELVEEQRRLLRPIFSAYAGNEIKPMGDGFFVEFASAVEAVRCAIAMQKTLAERNAVAPQHRRFQTRIGIHLGDVVYTKGDVFGDGVNIASRIQSLADPGGVCISEDIYRQVHNKLEARFVGLGKRELKNVTTPMEIYQVVTAGQQAAAPQDLLPDRSRIAVLPLVNFSPDPHDDYFSDGMTEELIYTLSKICCLKVIAQTSVMRYKNAKKTVAEIGRELKVGTVLEGSVRKADNQLRITVQLIDVQSEEHLWSDKYDRELKDVFGIQSDIANRVADALQMQLMVGEKRQITKKATENLEAYQLYLQGRYFWNKRTRDGLDKAVDYFKQAIQIEPGYALAYAGLADAYGVLAGNGHILPEEGYPKAQEAAQKALELDEGLAEAHTSLGLIKERYDRDFEGAEQEFRRAIELKPGYATAHQWYASLLARMGRGQESLIEIRMALELDPLSPIIITNAAQVLMCSGHLDEALTQFKRALEIDPSALTHANMAAFYYYGRQYDQAISWAQKALAIDPHSGTWHLHLATAYYWKSMYDEALEEFQKAKDLSEGSDPSISMWAEALNGIVYAKKGDWDQARQAIARLQERPYQEDLYCALTVLHFGLGEIDQGFEWLDKAYQAREAWLVTLKVEPMFENVRADPRFRALLKKMGCE
jgi:TolB-like protein/Flp pilus assembly protein TadD